MSTLPEGLDDADIEEKKFRDEKPDKFREIGDRADEQMKSWLRWMDSKSQEREARC
jgi:hypothetical protein